MRKFAALTVACALLLTAAFAEDVKKDKLADAKCPVTGKDVKAEHSVAYKGAKVYFCCPNCPKAFEKDTAKFAAKANHQLVQTEQAEQKKCPLTGRDLNEKMTVEVNGVEVTFCCGNCKGKVEKADDKEQITLIFADAPFKKAFEVKKPEKK